jgi:hypothetical protein
LDIFFIVIALSGKLIFEKIWKISKVLAKFISYYLLPSLLTIIIFDIILSIIGFGYIKDNLEQEIFRYPSPGDTFTAKPDVRDHNQFGFRGKFKNDIDSISIAFFGGSTGYAGDPSIPEIIKKNLNFNQFKVNVFNYSTVSSNHTQHIHRLIKFHDKFKYDFVIFYGGFNETLQYTRYDPRIGYPYNFYFNQELNTFMQILLKYSSIFGEIDKRTGYLSGIKKLNMITKKDNWKTKIIDNYWRDLITAKKISGKLIKK